MTDRFGRDDLGKTSELPKPIQRALARGHNRPSDTAALARMQSNLETALGTAFDREVERPSGVQTASQLRPLRWFGGGGLVAVIALGIAFWNSPPAAPEPPSALALATGSESQPLPIAAVAVGLAPPRTAAVVATIEPPLPAAALAPAQSPRESASSRWSQEDQETDIATRLAASGPRSESLAPERRSAAQLAAARDGSARTASTRQQPDRPTAPNAPRADNRRSAAELRATSRPHDSSTERGQTRAANGGEGLAANTAVSDSQTGLAEELLGLDQIRMLMTQSPEGALAAALEQQRQFPRGALAPERALLRLDALLRLGRTTEAQELAQQLLAAPNNQPYRARIRKLLSRAAHQ